MKSNIRMALLVAVATVLASLGTVGVPGPASAGTVQGAGSLAELLDAPDYSFERHAPVLRLYQAFFDREPDVGGAKYWIDIRNQGSSVLAIAGFMSGSQEWRNTYAGTDDGEFLTRVYANVLGRNFDQAGFNYWLDTLRGTNEFGGNPQAVTLSRPAAVFYITANPEFTNAYPFNGTFDPPTAAAGSGGLLTLRQWQVPTAMNPYRANGTKDYLAASLILEPLAEMTPDGELRPVLAATIPTIANGGIAPDRRSIVWQLRDDVVWSDGTVFTASDVVATWRYCLRLQSCSASGTAFANVASMGAIGTHRVSITFSEPTSYPYDAFVGYTSPVLQAQQFADCGSPGSCAAEALRPIGTGPFMASVSLPDERFEFDWNPSFRGTRFGQPFFGSVEITGGGFAEGSARAVLEEGTADYAWNLVVDPAVLDSMVAAGNGRLQGGYAANVEHLALNQTDPRGTPRSEFAGGVNPFFYNNPQLHRALSLAIDRQNIVSVGYGTAGRPTCSMWPVGPSPSTTNDWCLTQDVAEANRILDEDLGYLDTDDDGIRELPDGTPLSFELVTSVNSVRQFTQSQIRDDWAAIGVDTTLSAADPSLFFDRTCSSDDCLWKFFTDIQMFTNGSFLPDAVGYLNGWRTSEIPTSSNNWSGGNILRLNSLPFDQRLQALSNLTPDEAGYDELVIEANDILGTSVIPLVHRGSVSAFANSIENTGELNGWDSEYYNIEEWTRSG